MSQRNYWEERINTAFTARRRSLEEAAAKGKEARAAKIAKELGIDKDLKALERMGALRKSVVDRLYAVCRERGIPCYPGDEARSYLDKLASRLAVPGLKAMEKERETLLSCLHKACGPADLRTAVAQIEKSLAEMEETDGKQPTKVELSGNGEATKPGLDEPDFFSSLKRMRAEKHPA